MEILDVTNHVANKYHTQFGAAKCKVIRRGKGKKSALKLNVETLEEVPKYKYLGEMINNKGNLSDHITELEKKVKGATATIIAETGNKEFKGIKMQAIWQMVDAIIVPIMTYSCEGWDTNKEDKNKLQTIFSEAIKTILYLPKGTPTTILLSETGNIPIEYIIKRKQILQAKRIDGIKGESLIKDATITNQSLWRTKIDETIDKLHLKEVMPIISKKSLKRQIQEEINSLILEEIDNEAEHKSKVKHWRERKINLKIGIRPDYMNKLTRKQCNAKIKWVQLSLQILLRNRRNPRTHPPNLPKGRKKGHKNKVRRCIQRRSQ